MPLFSIIVPCYNSESYLPNTVNSILNQLIDDWELILIDDGSTDSTGVICDEYANRDNRIHVFHQPNRGVSSARNNGLAKARGEWIVFIDSDDWFTEHAFEIYQDSINKTSADRLAFNRYQYIDGKTTPIAKKKKKKIVRRGNELKYFRIDMVFPYYDKIKNGVVTGGIRGVNCNLYRRSLIDKFGLRFDEKVKIAEDALFNYDVLCHAAEMALINEIVGFYRISDDSVMHRYTPNIDEVNNETLLGYKKRIGTLLKDDIEFRIAWLGQVSECIFRAMKLKYLNSEYKVSLNEKIKNFMKWFKQDVVQEGLDYGLVGYLPLGKRQMMQCFSKSIVTGGFLIAYVSIQILKMRKYFIRINEK